MKKFMTTIAAVLCCAMTTTVFTACGDDDDNNTQPPVVNTFVAALMNYEFETTQATLDVLDFTVEYYDSDGKIKNEPMKELKWKKSIQHKLPATVGVRLKVQLKDGFDVENSEEVEIKLTYGYDGYIIDATGGTKKLPAWDTHTISTNTKSKRFLNWLADGNNFLPILYFIDAKGQYTSGNWE